MTCRCVVGERGGEGVCIRYRRGEGRGCAFGIGEGKGV